MFFKRFNYNYRAKNPIEYIEYMGNKHPMDGYEKGKTFIRGIGYISIKKLKIHTAQPLPENYTSEDIINAHKLYGKYVTLKLIAERYNSQDCSYYGYDHELTNVIKFGKSYDAFLTTAQELDMKCLTILKDKYGAFDADFCGIWFGNKENFHVARAYSENFRSERLNSESFEHHFFRANIEICFWITPMNAHYNSIQHEHSLNSMIRTLSNIFPICGKLYIENDNEELRELLHNMSVKQKIAVVYGDDVAGEADKLNKFPLTETDYYKVLLAEHEASKKVVAA